MVVTALVFVIAFAYSGMDGLAGVPIEVEGERLHGFTSRAGVPGGFSLIGLEIWFFIVWHKNNLFFKLHFLHFVHDFAEKGAEIPKKV